MHHCLIFNVEYRSISRNLGPYRIAHWLRENNWEAEVIDYVHHWTLEELITLAKSRITKETKFFGFSYLFKGWTEDSKKFLIWMKLNYPDIVLISGSNGYPLEEYKADWHIWGFGEVALEHLLKYLFSNGKEPQYIDDWGLKIIDASKYPAYPMDNYTVLYEKRDFLQPWEFLSIETGRGCKFKCSFCTSSVLGVKGDYSTSAESFERQLKHNWETWGIKNYIVAEETFNDRTEKVAKFAKVVRGLDFDPWFSAFVRLDLMLARPDDVKMLSEMNCTGHFYGIESFHHPTAKALRKGMATEKVQEGLLYVKDYFNKNNEVYRGNISLILGGPYETKETLMDSRQWLIDNWSDQGLGFYPMVIPLNGRKSDLSRTYPQFGYRPISIEELEKRHPNEPYIMSEVRRKGRRNLVWENDHMDFAEAIMFHRLWDQTAREYGFKKSVFAVAGYSGRNSTLKEKLDHPHKDLNNWNDEELEWYQEYKIMKLNFL